MDTRRHLQLSSVLAVGFGGFGRVLDGIGGVVGAADRVEQGAAQVLIVLHAPRLGQLIVAVLFHRFHTQTKPRPVIVHNLQRIRKTEQ